MSPEQHTPPGRTDGPGRTPRSRPWSRAVALLLLAVGGALTLASSVQTWARLEADDTLGRISVSVSGAALVPLLPAAAVVALAAVLAVPSVRGWLRRSVGAVVLGLAVVAGFSTVTTLTAVAPRARQWWGVEVGAVAEAASVVVTWGWLALPVAGLVVTAVGAGIVLVRGGQWAGLSARYERPSRPAGRQSPTDSTRSAPDPDLWQALDRGEDPTTSM